MTEIATKPELLAPAGDWDCVRAAIENGADAIYFGLDCGFNARARAANFSEKDLPDLMEQLHQRNVKGYVTLNTLAFPSELPEVERQVRLMAECRVDAVLVQDIGVARLAREVCRDLPLHASTQMTMTSAECIELAEDLGIQRVVLARELSVSEIKSITEATSMPLETFLHGALCVAYSGQCLTSESLGGRSANRGQCAQACRLPYDLVSDGKDVELGSVKYLLSPQDLAAYELTPELIDAGVCSFKIEGRLKAPEYVANITRHYRQAIDNAFARREVAMSDLQRYEMEMSFSRGFSPGWLHGCDHKMLVPGEASSKRGVLLGGVRAVKGNRVLVELKCHVRPGDGVVFEGDRASGAEQGGRVFGVFVNGERAHDVSAGLVELTFGAGAIDFERLTGGQQVWKTDDPKLNQRLKRTYDVADASRRVALDLRVTCRSGEPVHIEGRAENGACCSVSSKERLAVATKHKTTPELLREQLGRLGGTIYELRQVEAAIEGEPMVPFSVLGTLRRELIRQLNQPMLRSSCTISEAGVLDRLRQTVPTDDAPAPLTLHVLCRTPEQLLAATEMGIDQVYAEFQDIRQYEAAVATSHANGATIFLATPRIQKPSEMGVFRSLERCRPDGVLIRNFSGLRFFRQESFPVIADFSMNVANELCAQFLMSKGCTRVTASYDLNRDQLFDLVSALPANWLEIVIHQHMPMFHMEHCVFCAVLSPGTNKTNCGRPCDLHRVELRDRIGMEHPLTADVGCRNTLYNAVPQSSAEIVEALKRRGIGHFRVELLREDAESTATTIATYRDAIAGKITGREVWQKLRAMNRVGVTRGTLEERNPLAIL